jgi:hypothetical protein
VVWAAGWVGSDPLQNSRTRPPPTHVDAVLLVEGHARHFIKADDVILVDGPALAGRHVDEHPRDMKGFMESGEFSRGRESIRAEGSIVLLGNFDVDVQH